MKSELERPKKRSEFALELLKATRTQIENIVKYYNPHGDVESEIQTK